MRPFECRLPRAAALAVALTLSATPAWSAAHLWVVSEVYSNADGTVQFVELWSPSPFEPSIADKRVTSNLNQSPPFPEDIEGSTENKYLLLATAGFVALPGAPTPDLMLQDQFFSAEGDEIQWHVYQASILSFGPGELPTDGVRSLDMDGNTGPATPTNFAGDSWSAPPGVSGLRVQKSSTDASLFVSWDDTSCLGAVGHHIVVGMDHMLPVAPGGAYELSLFGSVCAIGGSAFHWQSNLPDPASGRFAWFLVLADDDAGTEGSWGRDSYGDERDSSRPDGSSGRCGVTAKSLSNVCE